MSHFLDALILEPLDNGYTWKIIEPFDYEVGNLGSGEKIDVPIGFVTDLASIPRLFWNIMPPFGRYSRAAVLHDWLYHTQQYTRKKSDHILLEAMAVLNVSWITRWTIFLGVRSGGWMAWNSHQQKNEEKNHGENQSLSH